MNKNTDLISLVKLAEVQASPNFNLPVINNALQEAQKQLIKSVTSYIEGNLGKKKPEDQTLISFIREFSETLNLFKTADQRKLTGLSKKISESKTLVAKMLRELKKNLDADGKALLELIQAFEAFSDELRDIVSAPVKEHKDIIKAREEAINEKIDQIRFFGKTLDDAGFYAEGMDLTILKARLNALQKQQITEEDYGDKIELAKEELALSIAFLKEKVEFEEQIIAEKRKKEIDFNIQMLINFRLPASEGGEILSNISSGSVKDLITKLENIEMNPVLYGEKYDAALKEKALSVTHLNSLYKQALAREDEQVNLDAEKEKKAKEALLWEKIEKIETLSIRWDEQPRFKDVKKDTASLMQIIKTLQAYENKLKIMDYKPFGSLETKCRTAVAAALDSTKFNLIEVSNLLTELQKAEIIEANKRDFDSKVAVRTGTVSEIKSILQSINNIRYPEAIKSHVQQKKLELQELLHAAELKQEELIKSNIENNNHWSELLKKIRSSIYANNGAIKQKIIDSDPSYQALATEEEKEDYLTKRLASKQECHYAAKGLVQALKYGVKIDGINITLD